MNILEKYLPFVKEQIELQEKLANRFADNAWRQDLHKKSCDTFKGLYQDIEATLNYINQNKEEKSSAKNKSKPYNVSYKEIEGLPSELIEELSLSDADKTEYTIEEIIRDCGGIAALDRILVELYKTTGEVFKRNALTSRLYKMAQKEIIYSVPNKKGVYALSEISDFEEDESGDDLVSEDGVNNKVDSLFN